MAETSGKIRVLLVDDHAVVRQGIRTFLELQDDAESLPIEVVGEAANGREAIEQTRVCQPDVVLLDLMMPEMNGLEATPRILETCPTAHVLILTSFGEEDSVIPALKAGAQGYLLKDIAPDELVQAVREAYRGRVQLHPEVAKKLVTAITAREDLPATKPKVAGLEELTEREVEVLRLIAAGKNNREIAEELVISEKTVKTHVSNLLGKLHLEDRTQAAILALKHGLGTDES
jgi:two-component system, NarL family, response regulator LiaR